MRRRRHRLDDGHAISLRDSEASFEIGRIELPLANQTGFSTVTPPESEFIRVSHCTWDRAQEGPRALEEIQTHHAHVHALSALDQGRRPTEGRYLASRALSTTYTFRAHERSAPRLYSTTGDDRRETSSPRSER